MMIKVDKNSLQQVTSNNLIYPTIYNLIIIMIIIIMIIIIKIIMMIVMMIIIIEIIIIIIIIIIMIIKKLGWKWEKWMQTSYLLFFYTPLTLSDSLKKFILF